MSRGRKNTKKSTGGQLMVSWKCPHCGSENEFSVELSDISGGCRGHHYEEYCYCSDRELLETRGCNHCEEEVEVYV